MKTVLRILIVEDSEDDALLVLNQIKKGGYDIESERVDTAEKMKAALKEKTWDIILSDYQMPHFNGLEALALYNKAGIDIPFIVISGAIGEEVAINAMKAGAHDYIMKNNLRRLLPTIERELRESINRAERKLLEQKQKHAEIIMRLQSKALESAANSIVITDKEGTIIWANSAFSQLTGYVSEEIIGQNPRILKSGKQDSAYYKNLWQTILTGKVWHNEIVNCRKDGTLYTEEMTITPVQNHEREITNFIAIKQNITERKQYEEALSESEKRYRSLFESSRDAIMTLEPPSWQFTSGNPSTLRMFIAKNETEFTAKEPWKLSPERQQDGRYSIDKAKEMIEIAMQKGSNFFEWTHKRINGEDFPATVLLTRMEISGKKFLQATVRDISENKQAEITLKKSEEKYKNIFYNIQDVYYETSLEGIILEVSPSISKMSKYIREELIGKNINEIYPDLTSRKILIKTIKEKGFVADFEIPLIDKDGKKVYCSLTSKLLYDKKNKPYGMVGSMRNVDARKKAEDELQGLLNTLEERVHQRTEELSRSEDLYFTTVNSFNSWVYVVDEQQKILFINTPLKQFLHNNGFHLDVTGKHIRDVFKFLSEENFSQYDKVINERMESIREGEFDVLGKKYYTQTKLSPIVRDKKVVRVVTTVHDNTKLKLIEEDIRKNLEREKELNALKSKFLSTVSHEFRTPLAGILSSTQLLKLYNNKWDEQKKEKIFRRIFDSIQHTISLLDDVSLINKGESNAIKIKPSLLNLQELLHEIIKENKQVYGPDFDIVTTFHFSQSQYFIDKDIIRHIFGNVLSNAIKYSGKSKKIIFNVTEEKNKILFNVIDYGIGIPAEDQKFLFAPFHRASNVEAIRGTGFGLSIVKRLVDLLSGEIEIVSELGKGTDITIKLPIINNPEKEKSTS